MSIQRSILIVPLCLAFQSQLSADAQAQTTRPWSLEEIFASGKFTPRAISTVSWTPDGKKFSYVDEDSIAGTRSIFTYRVSDGRRERVVDGARLERFRGRGPMTLGSYEWSLGGDRILVTSGPEFFVYDVPTDSFLFRSDTLGVSSDAHLSPDGTRVGFVRNNNLHVAHVETGHETALTADGSEGILNGTVDWVYKEEFVISRGWEWSPDGKRIAFWRMDQTMVPTVPLIDFPPGNRPSTEIMRYPRAGDPASAVHIGTVDVETGHTAWVDLGVNSDIYVPRIVWTTDPDVLSVQRLNRSQDTLEVLLADISNGSTRRVLQEVGGAWVDVHDNLRFLQRSDQFLWTSNRDGFRHLYLFNTDGSLVKQLTRGAWEVDDIVAVNERRQLVYFTAGKDSPLERHLYSIRFNGTRLTRLTREAGWHSISFSPDNLVYMDSYSNARYPTMTSLHTNDGTKISRLVVNTLDSLKGYPLAYPEFFTFVTSDTVTLHGRMIRPADFDPAKKYPVLLEVYGGPSSQIVRNQWYSSYWHQLLAQRGYVVVSVDNRGTGRRGRDFLQVTHKRLGLVETHDQIEAVKYLRRLRFVDSSRIGIWGWSYGGYLACMAMTFGSEYFTAGVAVGPVTDWRYYDNIYTERYMERPADNPDGYDKSSPMTYAGKYKGKLLIIHGATDVSVHWQNSMVLVDEFIKRNKQVMTMFYPGRGHSVDGASLHVYTVITNFILQNL